MNDIKTNVYPENDYRYYLEHHGISGQKWGVRKAPWYPISDYEAHSDRAGDEAQKIFGKYIYESLVPTDSQKSSDNVYRDFVNVNAKKIDKEAQRNLKSKGIRVNKDSDEYHDAVLNAADSLLWRDRDFRDRYQAAVKEDNAAGKPKYSESEKKRMMDNAVKKDSYNIDFLETVQNDIVLRNGGKELQKEYKKFLDNPDKYMETFEESDYQKQYRNTPQVQEALRIANAKGWNALTESQKELLRF